MIHKIIAAIAAIALIAACGNDEIPSAIEDDNKDDGKFEFPEGPYGYDDDLSGDPEAFLSAYKGKAYNGPHKVPGELEAEDFDEGGASVAYYESDTKEADASYRGAHPVDIRGDGNASGKYMIGDVQPGEWMSYTIEVEKDGAYAIDTYICKGDGSPGTFSFDIDGWGASRSISMPVGSWSDFSKCVTAGNINLTAGRHVMRYCAATPGNVDKFVFRRTGDIQNVAGGLQYPMSKEMRNPLFVDFPSPMYKSYLTGNFYSADASAHVWKINGKEVLYVYASHDMEPSAGCDRMDRYHVFSTEDMKTWTDHGEIMNAATVRMHNDWGCEGFMWAPDCAYNPSDGLYYFYFPHPESLASWNTTWRIGVAVSRYPDREFYVVGYIKGMPSAIDPCVFVDDDGQPYIYNGGGGTCYGGKLRKDDWTKLDGQMTKMKGLTDFHEATWIHKYNGKYYLSHSDNNDPATGGNRMRYAVSDSPLGPWENKGVYMYPQGLETNHGSIVKFKGSWYAFYHTANVSGNGTLRSVCVDELTVNADGTFGIVRNWGGAKGGKSPELTKDAAVSIFGGDYNDGGYHCAWFTKDRKAPSVSGNSLRGLSDGEWVRYSFNSSVSGTCKVTLNLPSSSGSRVLVSIDGGHPRTDGLSVPSSGRLEVGEMTLHKGESYVELRVLSGNVNVEGLEIKMD